jgi:SH3 domain-containing YSC84-like protein 1
MSIYSRIAGSRALDAPDSIARTRSVLDKADCVVVLPSVVKFAIGFGGSYGRGVMTCRGGEAFQGKWGSPTMIALEGASAGLQLGGQATDFILLLMSPKSASGILSSKVKLGGDVSAAAGPVGRNASAETDVTMKAEILSYSRARGLFAGLSLSGSTLRPDNDANKNLYGSKISAQRCSVFFRISSAFVIASAMLASRAGHGLSPTSASFLAAKIVAAENGVLPFPIHRGDYV